MWTVDRLVEESEVKNVDTIYPQFHLEKLEFMQRAYPQLFFSVYRYLSVLLGFPRPYYYY